MKHAPVRDINTHIATVTEGVLTKVTDYVLAELYFRAVMPAKWKKGSDGPAAIADRTLTAKTVSRALAQLTATGMVQRVSAGLPTLTYKGKERLEAILPIPPKSPATSLYLIAYDIPRTGNVTRNRIRELLLRSHAIAVLDSLWLSPVDPSEVLSEATAGVRGGAFFVTSLSPDAVVNGSSVHRLVARTYKLEDIALKYEAFIASAKKPETPHELRNIRYLYLSVVKEDPFLPAAFLPKGFPSEKAAKRFQDLVHG